MAKHRDVEDNLVGVGKHIHLHFDEKFFYKMLKHKQELEYDDKRVIKWEEYIKMLFGMK